MASDIDICNMALQDLGAEPIVSLTSDNENARNCNLIYELVRDTELRAHPWNFAIKRAQLAANATAPLFGPATSYTLPSDFLRLLPPDPADNFNTHDWQIEGGKILTNSDGVLEIRYIYRVTDPNQFDALFVMALAAKLSAKLNEKITQSNTKGNTARLDYRDIIREARRINAFENAAQEPPEDTWLTARY